MASRLSDTELHGVSNPSVALHLSQQAPSFLRSEQSSSTQFPWSLLSAPETSDSWGTYERVLLACLKTGDEKSAHLCLERLTDRFGSTNERIMGLRGLYQEAVTEDDTGLEVILQEYEKILEENPVNTVRHICKGTGFSQLILPHSRSLSEELLCSGLWEGSQRLLALLWSFSKPLQQTLRPGASCQTSINPEV